MNKERKSEFSARMHEIAQEATKLVDGQKNKSVIIISTESDDDGTEAMIAISGYGGELARGIADFATRDESKQLFAQGVRLAQKKLAAQAVEAMLDDMLRK